MSAEICKSITSCLSCSFYFDGELRSSYCRKLFFENSVKLVSPVSYHLSPNENIIGASKSFQYVPILDSLHALFSFEEVRKQFLNPLLNDNLSLLKDYSDGLGFKTNALFNAPEPSI